VPGAVVFHTSPMRTFPFGARIARSPVVGRGRDSPDLDAVRPTDETGRAAHSLRLARCPKWNLCRVSQRPRKSDAPRRRRRQGALLRALMLAPSVVSFTNRKRLERASGYGHASSLAPAQTAVFCSSIRLHSRPWQPWASARRFVRAGGAEASGIAEGANGTGVDASPSPACMMRRLLPLVRALLTVSSVSAARAHPPAASRRRPPRGDQLAPRPVANGGCSEDDRCSGVVRDCGLTSPRSGAHRRLRASPSLSSTPASTPAIRSRVPFSGKPCARSRAHLPDGARPAELLSPPSSRT